MASKWLVRKVSKSMARDEFPVFDRGQWPEPSHLAETERRKLAGDVERIATQIRSGATGDVIAEQLVVAATEAKRIGMQERE